MTVAARKRQTGLAELGIPLDLSPMQAKLVTELPKDVRWQFEPKWDGFRCIVFRDGDEVELTSRNTKPLTRYFPELVEAIKEQLPERCVLDGEVFWGQDRIELLDDALTFGRKAYRNDI